MTETDWGMGPAARLRHKTEAERDAYRTLFVHNTNHDVRPAHLEEGTLCHLCNKPIEDGQLAVQRDQGWEHAGERVVIYAGSGEQ